MKSGTADARCRRVQLGLRLACVGGTRLDRCALEFCELRVAGVACSVKQPRRMCTMIFMVRWQREARYFECLRGQRAPPPTHGCCAVGGWFGLGSFDRACCLWSVASFGTSRGRQCAVRTSPLAPHPHWIFGHGSLHDLGGVEGVWGDEMQCLRGLPHGTV